MNVHTTAVPIVRGLPVLRSATRLLSDPLRFISSLRAHGGVVAIRIEVRTLFVVVDPRLVRQMLVDKAHAFDKNRQFEKLRPWLGDGLLTSEGACHLRQRRLMQPAFQGSDNNCSRSMSGSPSSAPSPVLQAWPSVGTTPWSRSTPRS
jgi:cytochrome P450